jgi:hypothetical protein
MTLTALVPKGTRKKEEVISNHPQPFFRHLQPPVLEPHSGIRPADTSDKQFGSDALGWNLQHCVPRFWYPGRCR